jgi:RHS repeat-associated protein
MIGSLTLERLPFLAEHTLNSVFYFYYPDHLSSSRFSSTSNRTMSYDRAYAAFGEPYAQSGTADPSFTGQRQDTVAGLYDFPAREYSYQGRWSFPDPAGLAAVNPANPQSWNRYAYVMSNPLNSVDPLGLSDCPDLKSTCGDLPGTETGAPGVSLWGNFGDGIDFGNFWDNQSHVGIGGGNFGRVATFNVFQTFSVESDVTTTETNIDGSFGFDFLTYFLILPTVNGDGKGGAGNPGGHIRPNCPSPLLAGCQTNPPPLTPEQFRSFAIWYACGKSPTDNVKNWAAEGAMKGAITGAALGIEGGPPTMFVAGLAGAGAGEYAGLFLGSLASMACNAVGVYGPKP